ncbi:MAG: peptidylprolyl isomerase [Gemmatimonadaceae bacterium]
MSRFAFAALIASAAMSTGCGDADPLSKSHDVIARTMGHDLTAVQLTALIARTKAPVAKTVENGVVLADLWANYQRLGYAAAHDDSLESNIAVALTPIENMAKVNTLLEMLRKPVPRDSANKAAFDSAARGLYAIKHILFAFPPKATPAQKDSVVKLANTVHGQLTPANFSAMAKKYSSDTVTGAKGGYIGIFSKGLLNPSVAGVVMSLKPDGVSKLLRTQVGLDIMQRATWADAGTDYAAAYSRAINAEIDSTIINKMSTTAGLKVTSAAANAARAAIMNPFQGQQDSTVIATYDNGGKFTAAQLVTWVNLMEPQARLRVLKDLPEQADTVVHAFIRNVANRALLLRSADSAKLTAPDSLRTRFHEQFRIDLTRMWKLLGVTPEQLADSAKTTAEKEQLAARRVDRYMERGMSGEFVMSPVSVPIETVLNSKYPAVVSIPAVSAVMLKQEPPPPAKP